MTTLRDRRGEAVKVDHTRVVLGQCVKSGGAGSIYLLPRRPRDVAKLYHDSTDTDDYDRKIQAMLALTPNLPVREEHGQRYVQIAWPNAVVNNKAGHFLGFTMPLLDIAATAELEPVLQERQALANGLPTGLGAKITLAANLATVIGALHGQGHYVVDLKPVNLRFYRNSLYIALLDCDGFSIQGHNERFRASQFTPEYLAPEFQAKGLTTDGELAQDLFALAVVIFQLLNFGIHPFTGKPSSDRVPTDIPGRIRGGFYAYGRKPNPQMAPSPVSGHANMPVELREMFDRAFASRNRPSANDWVRLLSGYARRDGGLLVPCKVDPDHQHFAQLPCAACARMQLLDKTRAQQHVHQKQRKQQQRQARRQATRTTAFHPRTGIPRTGPSGLAGRLVPIGAVFVVAIIIAFVFHDRPAKRHTYPTTPPAPTAAETIEKTLPRVIVPTHAERWPPQTKATLRAVLEAVSDGDRSRYDRSMSEMMGSAESSGDAQPASLQLFYDELNRQRDDTEASFEARNAAYRKILDADPSATFVAIELGMRLQQRGESRQARAVFVLAAGATPRRASAWYGLGIGCLDMGENAYLASASIAVAIMNTPAGDDERMRAAFEQITLHDPVMHERLRQAEAGAAKMVKRLRSTPPPETSSP